MAGKLSPAATLKIMALRELGGHVQHAHGLVEQLAAAKGGHEHLIPPVKRAFANLKMVFMGAGFDSMAQLAGSMEIAAARGGSRNNRVRILRDGVGSLRHQLELEERTILSSEAARRKAEERAKQEEAE